MINIGIVGCGKIAYKHYTILTNNKVKNANLAAICDRDVKQLSRFENNKLQKYTDMHELAKSDNIDAISILTPSGFHAENILSLAKYGKPIIVEKPLALKLEDADKVIKSCDQHGVKLFVIKQNRFNPPIVKLKKEIEDNNLGKLILGTVRVRWCRNESYYSSASWRGTWKYDGGVLTNQASHHIDLLQWMLGEVESVFAKTSTALANIEAEDTAAVVLKFKNGALGIIEATTATRPVDLEGSISILGGKGSVVIGGFSCDKVETWNLPSVSGTNIVDQMNEEQEYAYSHIQYYNHVIESIEKGKEQLVDGLEARKSLELISAIYESVECGKEVSLRFSPKHCKLGL